MGPKKAPAILFADAKRVGATSALAGQIQEIKTVD